MATVVEILTQLGLRPKEAQVYMASLRLGPSPVSTIADRAEVQRTTTYSLLQSLAKKGFIKRLRRQGVDQFEATDPVTINLVMDTQRERLVQEYSQRQAVLQANLPVLRSLALPYETYPKVRFVEGLNAISHIYDEALDTDNGFCGWFDPQQVYPVLERQMLQMIERSNRQRAKIRDIAVAGPWTRKYQKLVKNPNHKIKVLPRGAKVVGDTVITKQGIYLVAYHPHPVAVAIESAEIVKSQQAIFDLLWNKL